MERCLAALEPDVTLGFASEASEVVWTADRTLDADSPYGRVIESGSLFVCVVDNAGAFDEGTDGRLWLLEQLSLARQPWKVVFLSEPIFRAGPGGIVRDRLDVAELLAREKVAFAFVPGGDEYLRTVRIGESPEDAVQYLFLPSSVDSRNTARPAWAARILPGPCVGLLVADAWRLRWQVRDRSGALKDLVEILAEKRTDYVPDFFTLSDLEVSEWESDGEDARRP